MIPREIFERTLLGFLAPVRQFIDDPSVSEIMINGPDHVYIERGGKIETTDVRFEDRDVLFAAVRNLAQFVGRHVDEQRPILEARLPDGSRVEAVLPPAAPDGPTIAIRRFQQHTMTMKRFLELGSVTPDAAEFLSVLIACKRNIIVSGVTGSGKTSMLNVLSSFCDEDERIVVIEDSRELQIQKPHVVQLESQPPDAKGRGQVTIRDLFKATLRLRPDRVIVGEIRGGEALEMIQAMTSGHSGALSTVHASYPIDTLNRIETMALMSDVELPLVALRAQISSAVDFIVQTARLRDGARCITHITEVVGLHAVQGYRLSDIFVRRFEGQVAGRVQSELVPTGVLPECMEVIHATGFDIPASIKAAAEAHRS